MYDASTELMEQTKKSGDLRRQALYDACLRMIKARQGVRQLGVLKKED